MKSKPQKQKPKKSKTFKDNADNDILNSSHHSKINGWSYGFSLEDYVILIPLFILMILSLIIGAVLIFSIFLIASACFVIPFYISLVYGQLGIIIGLITFPLGIFILHSLYNFFSEGINFGLDRDL